MKYTDKKLVERHFLRKGHRPGAFILRPTGYIQEVRAQPEVKNQGREAGVVSKKAMEAVLSNRI